jgi:hypothetical protein|tara:strand:+ start:842 stop:973 length:132 start_codon:yes stop_codon:yes gene_type:complete
MKGKIRPLCGGSVGPSCGFRDGGALSRDGIANISTLKFFTCNG